MEHGTKRMSMVRGYKPTHEHLRNGRSETFRCSFATPCYRAILIIKVFLFTSLYISTAKCQSKKIESNITQKGNYSSEKDLSSDLLFCLLNKDSLEFIKFTDTIILKMLLNESNDESFQDKYSEEIINKLCSAKNFNEIFRYKRDMLLDSFRDIDKLKTSNFRLGEVKLIENLKPNTKYKCKVYMLKLKCIDVFSKKIYQLKLYEIYKINKKWYLFEPSFHFDEYTPNPI